MNKKTIKINILCFSILLFCVLLFAAGTVNANVVVTDQGTDVYAGVIVEQTGKIKFIVKDRDTLEPIEGVSIELYEEVAKQFVFYGFTDKNGTFELEIVPETGNQDENSNRRMPTKEEKGISWQVYQDEYAPYPLTGEVHLDQIEYPHEESIYLDKNKRSDKVAVTEIGNGKGPNTGINAKWGVLIGGVFLFVLGLGILLIRNRKSEQKEDTKK